MPWVIAGGGGTSVTLTVVLSGVTSSNIHAEWDNPGSASVFEVMLRKSGQEAVLIAEVAGTVLEYDFVVVGGASATDYTVEIYSLNGTGSAVCTVPASTLLPNSEYRMEGQNINTVGAYGASSAITLEQGEITNLETQPIIAAGLLLASMQDPAAPVTGCAYRAGGSWVTDLTTYQVPNGAGVISGDNQPTPSLLKTDLKTLPAQVLSGQKFLWQSQFAAEGRLSYLKSLDVYANPSNWSRSAAVSPGTLGTDAGTMNGGDVYNISHILVRRQSGNYFNVGVVGDSTTAQEQPYTGPAPFKREGIWHKSNALARTGGNKVRFTSFGQGASQMSAIFNRARRVAPQIVPWYSVLLVHVGTQNQPFTGVPDAEARFAAYIALKDELFSATGITCVPLLLQSTGLQSGNANNVAGFARMRELIAGIGLDVSDVLNSGDGTMNPTYGQDGIHLNDTGVNTQAPAILSRSLALFTGMGADV